MNTKFISKKIDCEYLSQSLIDILRIELKLSYYYLIDQFNVVGLHSNIVKDLFETILIKKNKNIRKLANRLKDIHDEVSVENEMVKPINKNYGSCNMLSCSIDSEDSLLELYYNLAQYTENKDYVTHYLIVKIMKCNTDIRQMLCSAYRDLKHVKEHG